MNTLDLILICTKGLVTSCIPNKAILLCVYLHLGTPKKAFIQESSQSFHFLHTFNFPFHSQNPLQINLLGRKIKEKNCLNGTLNYDSNPQEPENVELKLSKPRVIFSSNESPCVLSE